MLVVESGGSIEMKLRTACLAIAIAHSLSAPAADAPSPWPGVTRECRPWAYNWWMGSAVDRENLARELRRYREGGLGGVHIVPIYGVKGAEARDIPYLSPRWMEMLAFTIDEASKLDLGVDMTSGSGWCFGGPPITKELAGQKAVVTNGAIVAAAASPKVKRAAPGGEGFMLNPFHADAMKTFLAWFTAPFETPGAPRPRAMYHDSYEYFGGNWSADVPAAFAKRHGYRIEDELEAFAGRGDTDRVARVRCDYRETLSDLLVGPVFSQWTDWCRARGILTRNQAHGAPVNLLDFYALADIPETEMFGRGDRDPLKSQFDERFGEGDRNPLISKFASSAAHTAGRRLTSAETSTWMAEHFCETFEEWKCFADLLFASGVNHVFYHGCIYSPDDAAWPGWLFYASSQMNPRNPLWREAPALNGYLARCQSVLQTGRPDNDLLVYWPIHDLYASGRFFQFSVHSHGWLTEEPLGRTARALWDAGVAFDYVSDRLLEGIHAGPGGNLAAPGGAAYRAILVPPCRTMPAITFARLLALAGAGATVIFEDGLPADVPGLGHLDERRGEFRALRDSLGPLTATGSTAAAQELRRGKGRVVTGPRDAALAAAGIRGEAVVASHPGTLFLRRRLDDGRFLFVANQSMRPMDGWFAMSAPAAGALILDPLTGRHGIAPSRAGADGALEVQLVLDPGHSAIVRTFDHAVPSGTPWHWTRPAPEGLTIAGPWTVDFIAGGPALPKSFTATALASWTANGDPATEAFAGTARYRTTFEVSGVRFQVSEGTNAGGGGLKPDTRNLKPLLLDLGDVRHVARVRLNGRDLGAAILRPYRVEVPAELLKPSGNELEIEVTNLAANRIRDLDLRKVEWRIFRDINLVNIKYKPFDASAWPVFDSGLLGPVVLHEIR